MDKVTASGSAGNVNVQTSAAPDETIEQLEARLQRAREKQATKQDLLREMAAEHRGRIRAHRDLAQEIAQTEEHLKHLEAEGSRITQHLGELKQRLKDSAAELAALEKSGT